MTQQLEALRKREVTKGVVKLGGATVLALGLGYATFIFGGSFGLLEGFIHAGDTGVWQHIPDAPVFGETAQQSARILEGLGLTSALTSVVATEALAVSAGRNFQRAADLRRQIRNPQA